MNDAEEAAEDILRLAALASPEARSVRVYRSPEGAPRLKIYRLGGPVELSDAVPVLENFGFRVTEEVPSPLDDEHRGFVPDFRISSARPEERRGGTARVRTCRSRWCQYHLKNKKPHKT